MKESEKVHIHPELFALVTCNTSKICDKRNFIITAADSAALTENRQLISSVEEVTVRYTFSQVKITGDRFC